VPRPAAFPDFTKPLLAQNYDASMADQGIIVT
jgi:hypothetical protein